VLPPVARSFRVTPTADGFVALVTLTPGQWSGLVEALAGPEGHGDGDPLPDLSDTGRRMAEGAAVMRAVRKRIAAMPTAEVVERLTRADVPCAPVLALDEVHLDPQVVASGSVVEVDHPVLGPIRQAAPAAHFDGQPASLGTPAPAAGAHGREVLHELGCDDDEVDRLVHAGVLLA
jgi:crotonobetainyl-CoA:carnitine CoA-transferase CaiB-like acyl-CoA transferase